jgi:hypothetical protein
MTSDKEKLALYMRKMEYYSNKLNEDNAYYGGATRPIIPNEVQKKLDLYKRKMEHYKQISLNENIQNGGSENGVKLILFNNNKFKNIKLEDQKRDNFLSSSKLSQIIGNKSYIIDENSNTMRIFRGNRQSMLNKASKMLLPKNDDSDDEDFQLKDNIKLSQDLKFNEVSIHSEANHYRKIFHKLVHEHIPRKQRHKFNRFMVVSFGSGACRNTLLYLSDVYGS